MAERPTPHSIAIATLIALYMDPLSPLQAVLKHSDDDDEGDSSNGTNNQFLLSLQRLIKQQQQPAPSLSLTTLLQAFPNKNAIITILLETLMKAVSTSIDGLVDLMISIEISIADGAFGIYSRQVCLGFNQLSFESMTRLWEALRDQVVEACTTCSTLQMDGDHHQQQSTTTHWSLSPHQKQELLRLQCLTLDEAASTTPEEELPLQASIIHGNNNNTNEIPAAHFLQFLQQLQRGSRVGALDALHRYFDYAMIAERKSEVAAKSGASKQVVLHYATLLLAAVHYEFGNVELAQTATQEAIHVAQQSGDAACVAHALSFLHLTTTTKKNTNKQDILQRCAVRALQGKLRKLVAGANLTMAMTTHVGACWEALVNATTDQPLSSHTTTTSMDRPTHMEDLSSPAEAMELLGQTTLVAATIWERMGVPSLSSLTTEMGLECYGPYLTRATKATAHESVARLAIASGPLFVFDDTLCRYGVALLPLKHAGTDFGTVRLLHEWAVRRGEYGHAQTLLHYLYSRLHPRLVATCQVEVAAQHAFLLARQGWVTEAKTKYQELVDTATKEGNHVHEARFLIQMAVTLLDANKQEFRAAVRPLRACLKLTGDHAMDAWHATATSIMAQVYYRMTKNNIAIAMIKGVLPTLRQHADNVWFVGEAYFTLTKCFMKREQVNEAMEALHKSCRYFLECQDFVRLREVYFWQARLYDLKNDVQQRDEASQRFVDVSQQMTKGSLRTGLGEIENPAYMERMARRRVHS
jgi:tetratricopeptide (TPR) repeat protein